MGVKILIIFQLLLLASLSEQQKCGRSLNAFKDCIVRQGLPLDPIFLTKESNPTLYATVNHQWNLRLVQIDPLAYFLPTSTSVVQIGVKCAKDSNIRVVPKSGSHSFEGYSFGDSCKVVIDFRSMRRIEVNQREKSAIIEAGALSADIYKEIWEVGFLGIPLGGCPSVGIGGFTLGGGTGSFAAAYGLSIDNVVEMTMVAADGIAYQVNAEKNDDLFWALRGVGAGYIGIVTEFKFKLFDAANTKITWLVNSYDVKQSAQIWEAYQEWITWSNEDGNAPTTMSRINFGPITESNRKSGLKLIAFHIQDNKFTEDNSTFLAKFNDVFPSPVEGNTDHEYFHDYMEFLEYTTLWEDEEELIPPVYLYGKSFFVERLVTPSELEEIGHVIQKMPTNGYVNARIVYEGGIPSKILRNATAYVHRDFLYSMQIEYVGPDDQQLVASSKEWIGELVNATTFMDSGESYQNWADGERTDFLQRHYAENLNELIKIKGKWDEQNYFQMPQSLPIPDTSSVSGGAQLFYKSIFVLFLCQMYLWPHKL